MRSVRLDEETEARLEETARVSGVPVSAIIRDALRRRCDEVLGQKLNSRLADVVGVVSSGGGNSRKTGRDFAAAVRSKTPAHKSKNPKSTRRRSRSR